MAVAVVIAAAGPAAAQTLDEATVDRIVGSEVKEDEASAEADEERLVAAIDSTAEAIGMVRKTTNVDKLDIVFLSDAVRAEGGPPPRVAEKIEEHKDEITRLREEIEANALLYHAIDSRRVLIGDVLAVEFQDPKNVVIYAAAKPAR